MFDKKVKTLQWELENSNFPPIFFYFPETEIILEINYNDNNQSRNDYLITSLETGDL